MAIHDKYHKNNVLCSAVDGTESTRNRTVVYIYRTLFYIFFAANAPYSVFMGDFLTADVQFLSSARINKLHPWAFLPIDGRLVGTKL